MDNHTDHWQWWRPNIRYSLIFAMITSIRLVENGSIVNTRAVFIDFSTHFLRFRFHSGFYFACFTWIPGKNSSYASFRDRWCNRCPVPPPEFHSDVGNVHLTGLKSCLSAVVSGLLRPVETSAQYLKSKLKLRFTNFLMKNCFPLLMGCLENWVSVQWFVKISTTLTCRPMYYEICISMYNFNLFLKKIKNININIWSQNFNFVFQFYTVKITVKIREYWYHFTEFHRILHGLLVP